MGCDWLEEPRKAVDHMSRLLFASFLTFEDVDALES